jgi:hypothetical protein
MTFALMLIAAAAGAAGCNTQLKYLCNGVRTGTRVDVTVGSGYANVNGGTKGAAESFCSEEIREACVCSQVSSGGPTSPSGF